MAVKSLMSTCNGFTWISVMRDSNAALRKSNPSSSTYWNGPRFTTRTRDWSFWVSLCKATKTVSSNGSTMCHTDRINAFKVTKELLRTMRAVSFSNPKNVGIMGPSSDKSSPDTPPFMACRSAMMDTARSCGSCEPLIFCSSGSIVEGVNPVNRPKHSEEIERMLSSFTEESPGVETADVPVVFILFSMERIKGVRSLASAVLI
mmetsp:Transcript_8332/g.14843  ORF Transcript_8332/g.14843 Transcript_8332/m.14843 type:complete len:204 (+) Transcript_8332:763-1374(+)